jgi:hypothetical protein
MDKFLNTVLPFIFVAVVVGVRIISGIRRQKRNQAQKGEPTGAQKTTDRGFKPWEDEYRDPNSAVAAGEAERKTPQAAPADDDDDDEAFSAWNLSVNDDPPATPANPPPAKAASPKPMDPGASAPSLFTALSSVSAVSASREIPAWLTSSPESRLPDTLSPTAVQENSIPNPGDGGMPTPPPVPRQTALANRLRNLSPLQQGVIMAELFGPPKGL